MHLRPLSPRLYLPVGFEAMGAKLAPLAPIIQAAPDAVDSGEYRELDPDPLLQIRPEDKVLEIASSDCCLRNPRTLSSMTAW
jgi:hypothetical protein